MRENRSLPRRLYVLGITDKQSFTEKRDIIFNNKAILVLLFTAIGVGLLESFFGYHLRSIIAFSVTALLLIPYYLQHKQRFVIAKTLTILLPFLAALSSSIIFGMEARTHYYLIATLVLGLVIFYKPIHHIILSLIHFSAFLSLSHLNTFYPPIIEGEDGALIGFYHLSIIIICIYTTLSEFTAHNKQYESKIIQLLDSLKSTNLILEQQNRQIESQAVELQRANLILQKEIRKKIAVEEELLSSNEQLEQFAYIASHDLKEPLRTVGSFVQLLNKRLEVHFDNQAKEYYQYILSGVDRMSSLLDDLLSLSQLNGEKTIVSTDLNRILNNVCHDLNQSIQNKKGDIYFEHLPTVYANKTQMKQLFQNLISNGLKFNNSDLPSIEIRCTKQEGFHLFEIRDNGIGIPKDAYDKIFVIFKRLHRRSIYGGTGIGLAICKKIIANHGGEIWVEQAKPKGTSIFFTLPQKVDVKAHNTVKH